MISTRTVQFLTYHFSHCHILDLRIYYWERQRQFSTDSKWMDQVCLSYIIHWHKVNTHRYLHRCIIGAKVLNKLWRNLDLEYKLKVTEQILFWTNLCHIKAPLGEPGGGSFIGTFKRQMKEGSGNHASLIKLIWASFLWIQIMLGAWVWWQGSHDMASEYGTQRACFQA